MSTPPGEPAPLRRGRAAWLVAFNVACLGVIGAVFWAQDWRYTRPTPVPAGLRAPPVGARLELPAGLPRRDAAGPLFVHFFNPACPCSRFNATHVRDLVAEFGGRVTFVAVVQDVEGPAEAAAALARYDLALPSVADPAGEVAHALGVYATPQAVLLDGERRLVYRGNYNTSRYHEARATQFARLALEGLLGGEAPSAGAAWLSELARRAWGCALPADAAPGPSGRQGGLDMAIHVALDHAPSRPSASLGPRPPPEARPLVAPPSPAPDAILARHYARADRIIGIAVAVHFLFGLAIAPIYNTWLEAIAIGGTAAAAFQITKHFAPGTFLLRAVAGTVLQAFCAQHIYQLHGMSEMHFFFFTSFAMMIVYLDWAAMWPGALLLIAQHALFARLHNAGVQLYFFEVSYVGVFKLFFHFGIALTHVGICGYWAHMMRQRALADALENVRLDRLVDERTVLLAQRNDALTLILDNVGQGFATLGPDGRVGAQRSRVLDRWFGPLPADGSFARWAGADDGGFAGWFELGLEGAFDGFLPPALALEQMPTLFSRGGRTFTLEYRAVGVHDERSAAVVLIVTDVTEARAREVAERQRGELVLAFHKLMTDRLGFAQFLRETDELLGSLDQSDLPFEELKRRLHTLKGNAMLFGLGSLSRQCHALEDGMASTGEPPAQAAVAELRSNWAALRVDFANALGDVDDGDDRVEVERGEYEGFVDALDGRRPHGELLETVLAWGLEPTRVPLARLRDHAVGIAARLGKKHARVCVESNGVRVPGPTWAPFWSALVHVVRNAIDHAVESEDERERSGKPRPAEIVLRTAYELGGVIVEVRDDGCGIDWDGLAERAAARGIALPAAHDSLALLLAEGLSTRDTITELSGRGIGFAAVAEAARRLGGTLEVRSERGRGTTVRFVFPAKAFSRPSMLAAAEA